MGARAIGLHRSVLAFAGLPGQIRDGNDEARLSMRHKDGTGRADPPQPDHDGAQRHRLSPRSPEN